MSARSTALLFAACTAAITIACIIPDRDIQVRTNDFNLYPVRFVEGIPLSDAASCACDPDTCECPLPDFTALPPYLDPAEYPFCICAENRIDAGRLSAVSLYVEDQDEVDGAPRDLLFAAALLDWNPTLEQPATDYVAYRGYLDPSKSVDLGTGLSYENLVIKRPRPYMRQIVLSVDSAFDLCNGAGRTLEPGFHTVSFMVTDRAWFQNSSDSGMPISNEGVPDISAGATYDIQTYVFQCLAEGDPDCGCMDIEP
jgi:hypothetical protein